MENGKKKVGCPPAILPMLTYLDEAFESSDTPLLLWHDTCRATFMSTWNIDFITLEAPNKSMWNLWNIGAVPLTSVHSKWYWNIDRYEDIPNYNDDDQAAPLDDDQSEVVQQPMLLRSQMPKYIKSEHCVVCYVGVEGGTLHRALTYNVHKKLQDILETKPQMQVWLKAEFVAMAGDIQYHSMCTMPEKNAVP